MTIGLPFIAWSALYPSPKLSEAAKKKIALKSVSRLWAVRNERIIATPISYRSAINVF